MIALRNGLFDEDREELVSAIVDGIVAEMTFEQMQSKVFDMLYDDLVWQEWSDLRLLAEEFAPEVLEGLGYGFHSSSP
jgi:hypothetical protein